MTEFLVGFFPGFECGCGSDECRGQVTPNDWRRPELQKRYAGYFTSAVEALIKSVTTGGAIFARASFFAHAFL